MRYNVFPTEQAEIDLRGIYEYIAFELSAPENAKGLIERLDDIIAGLDEHPFRYRLYDKEPWKSRGLRVLPFENYIIYYIPDNETLAVTIIRVIYSGKDIDFELRYKTKYRK